MLSKEKFCQYISDMQRVMEFDSKVSHLAREYKMEFFEPECSALFYLCMDLLSQLMEDELKDIEYFCLELNFGSDWTPGCVWDADADGNRIDIDMSSAEKLYDYLTRKK